jgi:hypothetical protein
LKPLLPHSASRLPVRQLSPSDEQQPGQFAGSQTQAPFEHFCPASQAGPAPQAQMPELVQVSARKGSQAEQARPALPQRVWKLAVPPSGFAGGVSQRLFRQQPFGQDAASHVQTPFWQC